MTAVGRSRNAQISADGLSRRKIAASDLWLFTRDAVARNPNSLALFTVFGESFEPEIEDIEIKPSSGGAISLLL